MKYIYALVSGELILYVGQTTRLKTREKMHRSIRYNNCGSKYIPDYIDWKLIKLEEVADDIVNIRERYYYDTLKPLYNRNRPNNDLVDMEKKVAEYIKSIELNLAIKSKLSESQRF